MEEQLAELGLLAALVLGVVLGLRHSLDPDHVVAVSTIVSRYRNPLRSFWVGVSWGLGHTTTLFLLGIVIIGLRLTIPDRLALLVEFFVGVMLVGLGAQVVYGFLKTKVHQHSHGHEEQDHLHFHAHARTQDETQNENLEHHKATGVGKPFFPEEVLCGGIGPRGGGERGADPSCAGLHRLSLSGVSLYPTIRVGLNSKHGRYDHIHQLSLCNLGKPAAKLEPDHPVRGRGR